jgi:hypothetical protein
VLTAAQWDATVRDGFNAFGAMTSYTPTWASSGTAPAIGNGAIVGAYTQIQKTVFFRIKLTAGSSTTYGTGSYTFTLPVSPVSGVKWRFDGYLFDSGSSAHYKIHGMANGSTTMNLWTDASPVGSVGPTAPVTLATGDTIELQGWFEAA